MRTIVIVCVALCALACTELPELELGSCGNGVVEAGEDCDGASGFGEGTACGDGELGGEANACFFVCSDDAVCPEGWRCGGDGRCRRPMGHFTEAAGSPWRFPVDEFAVGDLDGDGLADLIGGTATSLSARFGTVEASFPDELDVLIQPPEARVTFADLSGDGRLDVIVPTAIGLATFLGTEDRRLEPVVYPSELLGAQQVRIVNMPTSEPLTPAPLLMAAGVMAFSDGRTPPGIEPLPGGHVVDELAGRPPSAALRVGTGQYPLGRHTMALAFRGEDEVWLVDSEGEWGLSIHPVVLDFDGGTLGDQGIKLPTNATVGNLGAWFYDVDGVNGLDLVVQVKVDVAGPIDEIKTAVAFKTSSNAPTFNDAVLVDVPVVGGGSLGPALLVAEFSGDGVPDYVTPAGVFISCFGGGCDPPLEATFPSEVRYSFAGPTTSVWREAHRGDFNGDGIVDFVATIDGSDGLFVYINVGVGLFNPFIISTDGTPLFLRVGDYDGDLVDDVAFVQTHPDGDRLFVSFGATSGAMSDPVEMGVFDTVEGVEQILVPTDPLHNDVTTDLLVVTASDSDDNPDTAAERSLAVLFGSSSRRMSAPFVVDDYAMGRAVVGRFDDDDHPDVLALASDRDGVGAGLLFLGGTGDGRFDLSTQVHTPFPPVGGFAEACSLWAAGNVDVSSATDEVVGLDGGRGCAPGQQHMALASATLDPVEPVLISSVQVQNDGLATADRLELFDADNDGDPDVLATYVGRSDTFGKVVSDSAGVVVYWNIDGEFTQSSSPLSSITGVHGAATILIDADELPELLVLVEQGLLVSTLDPDSHLYGAPVPLLTSPGWRAVRVGDINGDGLTDIALLLGSQVQIFLAEAAPPLGDPNQPSILEQGR